MSAYDRLIAAGAEHWAFGIHGTKGDENVNAALDRIAAPSPALTRATIAPGHDDDNCPWKAQVDEADNLSAELAARLQHAAPSPALTREVLLLRPFSHDDLDRLRDKAGDSPDRHPIVIEAGTLRWLVTQARAALGTPPPAPALTREALQPWWDRYEAIEAAPSLDAYDTLVGDLLAALSKTPPPTEASTHDSNDRD